MAKHIVEKINKFGSYKFDEQKHKVINLRNSEETDIDEFLDIQYLLDCNRVSYSFEKNFEIRILR